MCRPHRRCPGNGDAHRRALNTANKRVERARNALRTARATGDTDAIHTAEHRLDQARSHLATTRDTHNTPQSRGHDTTEDNNTPMPGQDPQNPGRAQYRDLPGIQARVITGSVVHTPHGTTHHDLDTHPAATASTRNPSPQQGHDTTVDSHPTTVHTGNRVVNTAHGANVGWQGDTLNGHVSFANGALTITPHPTTP